MSDDARLFVGALIVALAMTAVIGYSVHGALQERRRRHTPDALLKISRAYSELAERVTQLEHDRARDHETIMQLRVQVCHRENFTPCINIIPYRTCHFLLP